ncbi:unnamed protein product [Lampetra planeri]
MHPSRWHERNEIASMPVCSTCANSPVWRDVTADGWLQEMRSANRTATQDERGTPVSNGPHGHICST